MKNGFDSRIRLVNNLKEVEEFFVENGFGEDAVFRSDSYGDEPNSGRLRLDFELDSNKGFNHEQTVYIMFLVLWPDLLDLGIHGDFNDTSDPLLKVLNGAKVRGKTLEHTEITSAMVFSEPKQKKGVTEYTMYLTVRYAFK